MKMPYPIQPARRDIPNGYEVSYAERDLIPIRFRHFLWAIIGLPAFAVMVIVLARLIFSIPS